MKNKLLITGILVAVIIIMSCSGQVIENCFADEMTAENLIYTVKPGDSLYLLSIKFGTTINELKVLNKLETDLILIGQKLMIPAPSNIYIVQPGDTLYFLSKRFESSINEIKRLNNLVSDLIYVGQRLRIPEVFRGKVTGQLIISNKSRSVGSLYQEKISTEMVSSLNSGGEGPDFQKGELIVRYKPVITGQTVDELEKDNNLSALSVMEGESGKTVRYELPEGKTMEEMVEYFEGLEEVEWVEPNYFYYPTSMPNDTYYDYHQWNLVNLNMEAAWDLQRGSESVIVAVLDTGVVKNHPDLKANLLPGADFVGGYKSYSASSYVMTDDDPSDETTLIEGGSHGTHVTGIIGAVTDNFRGVAGVNWKVKILPVRVMEDSGGSSWDIAEGIYFAVDHGAKVINMSLGGRFMSRTMAEAIEQALKKGVTVVAAAGNEGGPVYYPAALQETIAVGAVGKDNSKTIYSNFGPEVDVVAPGGGYGESIYSTWGYFDPAKGQAVSSYGGMIGTSMAAPHVSGIAALLVASGVSEPEEIRSRLTGTSRDLGMPGKDDYYGYGLVDAYGALLGQNLKNPDVFAAVKDKDGLKIKSSMIKAGDDGRFTIENISARNVYIVGWRDVNLSGAVDQGDYFGITERPLEISTGDNTVDLTINYISDPAFQLKIFSR